MTIARLFNNKKTANTVTFENWCNSNGLTSESFVVPGNRLPKKSRAKSITDSARNAGRHLVDTSQLYLSRLSKERKGYVLVNEEEEDGLELTEPSSTAHTSSGNGEPSVSAVNKAITRRKPKGALVPKIDLAVMGSTLLYIFIAFSRNIINAIWMISKGVWESLEHMNSNDFPSEIFFSLKLVQAIVCLLIFAMKCIKEGKLPSDCTELAWAIAATYRAIIGGLAYFGVLAGPAAMLAIISSCAFDGAIEAYHIYQFATAEKISKALAIDILFQMFATATEEQKTALANELSLAIATRNNGFQTLQKTDFIEVKNTPNPSTLKRLIEAANDPTTGQSERKELHRLLKITGSDSAEMIALAMRKFLTHDAVNTLISPANSVASSTGIDTQAASEALGIDKKVLRSYLKTNHTGEALARSAQEALSKACLQCNTSKNVLKLAREEKGLSFEAKGKKVALALADNQKDSVQLAIALECYGKQVGDNTQANIQTLLQNKLVREGGKPDGKIVAVMPTMQHAALALLQATCNAREANYQKKYWSLALTSEMLGIGALATLTFFIPMIACQPAATAILIAAGALLAVLMCWMLTNYFRNLHREHTDQLLIADMLEPNLSRGVSDVFAASRNESMTMVENAQTAQIN